MSNAPAWLRCENCLWWASDIDFGAQPGCNYDIEVAPKSPYQRCNEWTCKRCFNKWDLWFQEADGPINHFYCKIIARGKPDKGKKCG
jgi:hypothetical protein